MIILSFSLVTGKKYVGLHSKKLKLTYACTVYYYYNTLKEEGVGGGRGGRA
jgi:hypothetical protein